MFVAVIDSIAFFRYIFQDDINNYCALDILNLARDTFHTILSVYLTTYAYKHTSNFSSTQFILNSKAIPH